MEEVNSSPSSMITATYNSGVNYLINITTGIESPDYFNDVISVLANAQEQDTITWNFSSYGGFVSSLNMLLGWKAKCPARQVHVLMSDVASAGSLLFLSPADEYYVSDLATLMLHEIQTSGGYGTVSNVKRSVDHLVKVNEQYAFKHLKHFLTDEEIYDLLNGGEFYFDSQEINERLQNRNNILQRNFAEATQESLTNEFETTLESFSDEELEEELEFLKKELKKRKSKKKVVESVGANLVD